MTAYGLVSGTEGTFLNFHFKEKKKTKTQITKCRFLLFPPSPHKGNLPIDVTSSFQIKKKKKVNAQIFDWKNEELIYLLNSHDCFLMFSNQLCIQSISQQSLKALVDSIDRSEASINKKSFKSIQAFLKTQVFFGDVPESGLALCIYLTNWIFNLGCLLLTAHQYIQHTPFFFTFHPFGDFFFLTFIYFFKNNNKNQLKNKHPTICFMSWS